MIVFGNQMISEGCITTPFADIKLVLTNTEWLSTGISYEVSFTSLLVELFDL